MGFRVFAFERRETTRSRLEFTVKADLGLIRRYDIRMQELPLLCRSLLERSEAVEAQRAVSVNSVETRALTFTEDEMRACATDRAAAKSEAARKKKPPRRPIGENPGAAWRG
jgi:hypothetical protein